MRTIEPKSETWLATLWRGGIALVLLCLTWLPAMAIALPGMIRAVRIGKGATRATWGMCLLALVTGCSSSRGGSGVWQGGPWKDHNIAALEVNLQRAGYPKERAQQYRLSAAAEAGRAKDGGGAWHNGQYYAYNQPMGRYRHHCVYVVDPNLMERDTPPSNVIRHEQLHSVIESSPDHGGNPLPNELRRGGTIGHPREVFLNGRWHNSSQLCQDRWPRRLGRWASTTILRREEPDFVCGVDEGAEYWR